MHFFFQESTTVFHARSCVLVEYLHHSDKKYVQALEQGKEIRKYFNSP